MKRTIKVHTGTRKVPTVIQPKIALAKARVGEESTEALKLRYESTIQDLQRDIARLENTFWFNQIQSPTHNKHVPPAWRHGWSYFAAETEDLKKEKAKLAAEVERLTQEKEGKASGASCKCVLTILGW